MRMTGHWVAKLNFSFVCFLKLQFFVMTGVAGMWQSIFCMFSNFVFIVFAYYSVSHVQVKGKSLSPAFGVEIHEPSGQFVLKNNMQAKGNIQPSLPENDSNVNADLDMERDIRDMLPFVNMLQGNVADFDEFEWNDVEEGMDEEFVV